MCMTEAVNEMIRIEYDIHKIYDRFGKNFPKDKDFWYQLSREEYNHSALLKSVREHFSLLNCYENELAAVDCSKLEAARTLIDELLDKAEKDEISFEEACKKSALLEEMCCEAYYEIQMTKEHPTKVLRVLQELNGSEVNHAARIRNHLREVRF